MAAQKLVYGLCVTVELSHYLLSHTTVSKKSPVQLARPSRQTPGASKLV